MPWSELLGQRSRLVLMAVGVLLGAPIPAGGTALPPGEEVARRVEDREEGERVSRLIEMELRDRRGKVRMRSARAYRRDFAGVRKTLFHFLAPSTVRGTAFLTYDYQEADRDDDQWLYLPALRRSRRISAADRGSYFLGTDFSYDDIRTGGRVSASDYSWTSLRREAVAGSDLLVLEGLPKSPAIADELGYGRAHFWINEQTWMVHRADFWDTNQNRLKTIRFEEIRSVDGIWTALRIEAENLKTGHRTLFRISEVDYEASFSDRIFRESSLSRMPR